MKGYELVEHCIKHKTADEDNSCSNCKNFIKCSSFCRDMHVAEPNAMNYYLNVKEYTDENI